MYGMKTKWMGAALLAALIGATGCSKNEDGGGGSNASKLESYAMTPEWINYATAVSSDITKKKSKPLSVKPCSQPS